MFTSLKQAGARHLGRGRDLLCRAIDWICRQLDQLWRSHRDLITTNASYAAALASTTAAIVAQTNGRDLLEALATGLLAIYMATQRRAQRRSDGFDEPYAVWDPI